MTKRVAIVAGLLVQALAAQTPIMPLAEVRAGMRGVGKTVFSGDRVEEFGVEILGVLENAGPKQSVILARLYGDPLEETGVLQGMSGSPVYIDGKLVGAVALAFPLATEPIAGIRPIEEMLQGAPPPAPKRAARQVTPWEKNLTRWLEGPAGFLAGGSRMMEIATPVSFSGFTRRTIDYFAPQLRALGLEPRQGMSGGGTRSAEVAPRAKLEPGSMISVLLVTGDMSVGADGTVTYVDGERIYAFGHRFLSVGATELPFARAEVLALAPNLATSFKISAARELLGAITADYSTAVRGELGRRAPLVPVSIRVKGPPRGAGAQRVFEYRMEMVNERFLTPFLVQMIVYSAIDATERTLGTETVVLRGEAEFENGIGPVRLDDVYAGEANVPVQASLGVAAPLAYLLQSGFDELRLKAIRLEVEVFPERRQWVIDQIWPSRKRVRPGESVDIMVALSGEDGAEQIHRVTYRVPPGAPTGPLYFTVADAMTTNLAEYYHLIGQRMRTPTQLVRLLNELRSNSGVYVRVWRPDRSYKVQGRSLPAPPPSVALVMGRTQPAAGGAATGYTSKVAELRIELGDAAVTGSKTIQVEVRE